MCYVVNNEIDHDFKGSNFYVYLLIDPSDNKPFYVGKGRDNRAWKHISLRSNKKVRKTNPHLYNKISKIIDDGLEVICTICFSGTEEVCFKYEQELIQLHGRTTHGGILTNICKGGEGLTRDGISVVQYTMWGEYINTYPSAKEAARINGFKTYSCITSCCKRKERSYKGFLWCYENELPQILTCAKPVYQWTLDGILIKIHRNCAHAARELECDSSTINDCANGLTNTAKGFLWSKTQIPPSLKLSKKKKSVIHEQSQTIYASVIEASTATGCSVQDICAVCKGKKEHIKGFTFKYVKDKGV